MTYRNEFELPKISGTAAAATFEVVNRRGVNVATFLHQVATRIPNSPAVIDSESGLTYSWKELAARASHTAYELVESGIGRRDTVLVLSQNHVEMTQAFWAVMHAGGVLAPPNAKLTPTEVLQLAQTTQPVAVIAHVDMHAHVRALLDAGFADNVFWIGASTDGANTVVTADANRMLSNHDGAKSIPIAPVAEDDPVWYFFTSGSTGAPKAPVFTHRHLGIVLMNHYCDLFPGEDENGASFVIAPLSHGAGIHYLAQVFTGCPSILYNARPFDGEKAWQLFAKYKVTNMFTVPTILNRVVQAMPPSFGPQDHTFKYIIYAGAPLMAADQQKAIERLGPCLVQYFGLGEVTGSITALRPVEHLNLHYDNAGIGTCGRPRTGIEISIQDDNGTPLPAQQTGEVCVAGPTVCGGYLNNDKANAESFKDGWFHTGDVGYVDERGYLYLTGRKSDMYISGGSNIYPREIEELLLMHPRVEQASVIGIPDEAWGEIGVATIQGSANEQELVDYLKTKLAKYKIPKRFTFVDEMPVTAYGKIDKKELKRMIAGEVQHA